MHTPSRLATVAALFSCLAFAVVACGSDHEVRRAITTVPQARADAPNVVVIMTDDQTVESLRVMEQTNALLAAQGTTFSNFFTPFPLCCPSRASFLTGQYAFNHGVLDNLAPNGGYYKLDNINTLPVWLQQAGYATSLIGHYLYTYGTRDPHEIPPGWDRWFATIDPSTFHYFDYDVNDNGQTVHFGTDPADYQTDVMADRAVSEVQRLAAGDKPFFLNLWMLAPHVAKPERGPGSTGDLAAVPAPRHLNTFDEQWWTTNEAPAFNEQDLSDKPGYVSARRPLNTIDQLTAQNHYQRALESLLAVDEAVGRIVDALDDAGSLDDTVIMFWSDNGYLQGEHRIRDAKVVPYEESIHVPLIIRGPGFPVGATAPQLTANIDLAPTILELAGVTPSLEPDGQSLLPVVSDPDPPPDDRVIYLQNGPERQGAAIPHYDGVRVPGYSYVEYEPGASELYDLSADPFQLVNRAGDPAYASLQAQLADLLGQLRGCQGEGCREPRFVPPG